MFIQQRKAGCSSPGLCQQITTVHREAMPSMSCYLRPQYACVVSSRARQCKMLQPHTSRASQACLVLAACGIVPVSDLDRLNGD